MSFFSMNQRSSGGDTAFQFGGRRDSLDDFVFDDPLMKSSCADLFAHAPDCDQLLQQRNDIMYGDDSLADLELTSFLFTDKNPSSSCQFTDEGKMMLKKESENQLMEAEKQIQRRVEKEVQERLKNMQRVKPEPENRTIFSPETSTGLVVQAVDLKAKKTVRKRKVGAAMSKVAGTGGRKRKIDSRSMPARQKKNIRERLRRASMSDKFKQLCDLVIDNCTSKDRANELRQNQDKLSKAMVLSEAIEVMRHMIGRMETLDRTNKDLMAQLQKQRSDVV